MRGPSVFAAIAASIVGVSVQLQQPSLWHAVVYAGMALFGCVVFGSLWRRKLPRGAMLLLMWVVGMSAGAGFVGLRAVAYQARALDPTLEGRDLRVTGVVAKMPQHGETGTRFRLDVESMEWVSTDAGKAPTTVSRVPPRLALAWYATATGLWSRPGDAAPNARPVGASASPLHAGERWRLTVRLRAPHGTLNPHGFDQELAMWEQGVQATGSVRVGTGLAAPTRLGETWRHPIERARETVRDAVFAHVADRRAAGVVAALVTGDQSAIDRADWDIFRTTGVAHLVAISGVHITMFAWLAGLAVGVLWRRSSRLMQAWPAPHAALLGGVLLATCYALFSGWGVPSQRTVWMLATVAALRLSGRRWPWPHVWLLACWVVVLIDPWALMQAGFWLSFVAVGALYATDASAVAAPSTGLAARLGSLCREQWVVTLALTPLTLLLFQQVSVVGLLANAVAIPWVTLVVTPLAMLGVLVTPLWTVAGWAVQALGLLLQGLAAWPWAAISMPAPPLWAAICGVGGGLLLAMRLPWALRALGLPLLLPVLLWQVPRPLPGEFDVLAADVGQGNAVLVRTATHSLLYDAGPRYSLDSDAGQRVLVPLLRALGERIDLLVLSHRDIDHTGGAPAVLASQPRAKLLSSIEPDHPLQALRPAQPCVAGQRWTWDGVDFEVLHPGDGDHRFVTKPNALSCVLRVRNQRSVALLPGDVERLQEAALVARVPDLRADLLLVPHHGSKTSSSDAWLDAVRPRVALVQAGYRNRFGHPAEEVSARYRERGIDLIGSARCGALTWSSLRPSSVVCERSERARYWHHQIP